MRARHTTYFELLEALEQGCPICFLIKKATYKFMDNFLYESVNDVCLRQEIKTAQGFCNRHAWQLQKLGDGFGQAIIYNDLANILLEKLKEIENCYSIKEMLKRVSLAEEKKQSCMFCKQEKENELRYIATFWEGFEEPEFKSKYNNSFGLCLPHISLAFKVCKSKKLNQELIHIETAKLSALLEELKEFMRKHDYRFSQEKFGKEADSWIRAIEKLVGKEGVS